MSITQLKVAFWIVTLALLSTLIRPFGTILHSKQLLPTKQQQPISATARAGRTGEFVKYSQTVPPRIDTQDHYKAKPDKVTPLSNMAADAASQVEVVKSPQDSRVYRYIELENKMRVLLISDPEIGGSRRRRG